MGTIPYRSFLLSDGTTDTDSGILHAIDLLDRVNGFCITDWQMRVTEPKGGGVWADSALADGRFLKVSKLGNVQEVLTVEITDWRADGLADRLHLLYDLLEQARNWGPSGWSNAAVWIEAVGVNETNVRYALVHDYRTPGAGYPFGQPFWQTVLNAGIPEFEIVLEREPAWRGNPPGEADCVELSAMQEMCAVYPLEFDNDTSFVDLGNPAALQNLPAGGDFTVDAWIYADSWGESASGGNICNKSQNFTVGWTFWIGAATGLSARIEYDTQPAVSTSGVSDFSLGEWHHVAVVFNSGTDTLYLWVDGTAVAVYDTQQAGNAAPVADAAVNAYIGNTQDGARCFDGEIGWVRISSSAIYTPGVDFDPPERCVMPSGPTAEWVGIHEGTGTTIYDLSPNANDGTASNTTWDDCCPIIYGNYDPVSATRETSCDSEFVFVSNKHNAIGLTHIFVEDGGVFGANLLANDPPYSLLPAVPAANDRVYFGIASTVLGAGPFCSLVFDLSQIQTGIADIDWEFWDGAAWSALTVQDNTNANGTMSTAALNTPGVHSLHWSQDPSWSTSTVNGVTALWVRAEVQDAGAQQPIQANRHVYTVLTPYFEIQKDELNGDIPALARFYAVDESDNDSTSLFYNRAIMGLRTVSRGTTYTPYINLSDRDENQAGPWTVIAYGAPGMTTDTLGPTGRVIYITNPFVLLVVARATCSAPQDYQGTFHLYVRAYQVGGAAGDISIRARASCLPTTNINSAFWVSDEIHMTTVNNVEVIDFGSLTIDTVVGDFNPPLRFYFEVNGNGATDIKLIDFILMPVDEWAADVIDPANTANWSRCGARDTYPRGLSADRISDLRRWRATLLGRPLVNDYAYANWQGRAAEGPILLPNTRQRVWMFCTQFESTSNTNQVSPIAICNSAQAWATERYLMMRGDK